MEKEMNLPNCCSAEYADCFGNNNGKCAVLTDCKFKGSKCPFYKTRQESTAGRCKALARLLLEGRTDLIGKYESCSFLRDGGSGDGDF